MARLLRYILLSSVLVVFSFREDNLSEEKDVH